MQFSMDYDETALTYNSIQNINLVDLLPSNFGNPSPEDKIRIHILSYLIGLNSPDKKLKPSKHSTPTCSQVRTENNSFHPNATSLSPEPPRPAENTFDLSFASLLFKETPLKTMPIPPRPRMAKPTAPPIITNMELNAPNKTMTSSTH